MNRQITTDLENILSLITCADDYGFRDGVLFDAFSGMMERKLSLEEIEWYSIKAAVEENQNYNEVKTKLLEFRKEYCIK